MTTRGFAAARRHMIERHLAGRGIRDPLVLAAMGKVPRETFVAARQAAFAYDDGLLPIGEGQTISQPYVVARMTEALALTRTDRVLEIGTGSGYSAAILAEIAEEVYTVERLASLAERGGSTSPISAMRTSTSGVAMGRSAGPSTRPTTRSW